MTYNEFTNQVIEKLRDSLKGNPSVVTNTVIKNNGVVKTGITIMYPGEEVSPNIYLDDFYDENIDTDKVDEIAESIKDLYYKSLPPKGMDVEFYFDYEKVREKLSLKVVNRELNENLLKNVPHYSFLDMKVVVYCKVKNDTIGNGSILVHNEHLSTWNVSKEKLFEDAYNNFINCDEPELVNITDILLGMMGESFLTDEEKERLKEEIDKLNDMYETIPMKVLSNKDRFFGASQILNEKYLCNLCNSFESDFYILPSSIHELIIIPDKLASSAWELKEMVRTVNETSVAREELLSDSVYFFSKQDKKVMIAM